MLVCDKERLEALSRRLPVEDFAGAFVEHFLVGAQLLIGDFGQVGALWQVVADAVVLALAGGPLPGAVGVAKEDFQFEVGREGLVLGHFLALVVGETLAQQGGQRSQFALEGLPHAPGVLFGQMAQEGVAGGTFDQHTNGRTVASAQNQVALVVAGNQAGFHLGRALVNQDHVLETPGRSLGATTIRAPRGVVAAQACDQISFEFTAGNDINVAINRFVGGVHRGLLGMIAPQATSDLPGRPASTQPGVDLGPQGRVLIDVATPLVGRRTPLPGLPICGHGLVARATTVPFEFTADRPRRAPQSPGDVGLAFTSPQAGLNLDAFAKAEGATCWHQRGPHCRQSQFNRRGTRLWGRFHPLLILGG